MKYPRLKPELDRRKKLMPYQIAEIKKKRKRGIYGIKLAIEYQVDAATITYWTNEMYHKNHKQKAIKRSKKRWKNESERESLLEQGREIARYLKKVNPVWRKYKNQCSLLRNELVRLKR